MKRILLQGTSNTPEVSFDEKTGVLEIKGVSRFDDAMYFYDELVSKIAFLLLKKQIKQVHFCFVYFDSLSSRKLIKIFDSLGNSNQHLEIMWNYQEDDAGYLEDGQFFQELCEEKKYNLEFKFIKII